MSANIYSSKLVINFENVELVKLSSVYHNFNVTRSAPRARGKFVSGAKVFAAVPRIGSQEVSFQISDTEGLCGMTLMVKTHFIISFSQT